MTHGSDAPVAKPGPSSATATGTLLIVDDEAAHMSALCDTLADRGFATAGFTSPHEALSALRNKEFDLLLTDLMMPGIDGIELLRRAQEIQPQLVGVLMTGHGAIDTAVEAMKVGALDYILKPFKLSAVLPVLSRALAVRHLRLENAALQKRVLERTLELEAANRDLEAFAYSVSHDLRAPLRAIHGYTGILEQDFAATLPQEAQRLLGRVSAGAMRMDRLISDLLRLSRLGRGAVAKEPIDVAGLVQEVIDELRQQQPERRVESRIGDLPSGRADPALIRQVFVNLLSNAFKFTRRRETGIIEVSARQEAGETEYVVRDNGAGFDMRYAGGLFSVFRRLHNESEFEGTGVGLSIVQRIIERHGGRIWAEGAVDQGAVFHFTLPSA